MSKYSDKTFEKTTDDMPNQVTEVSTMEGSFIYTALWQNRVLKRTHRGNDTLQHNSWFDGYLQSV